MDEASILGILAVLLTAVGIFVPARISIRNDRRERAREAAEDLEKEIGRAIAPVAKDLVDMEKDRDYWRDLYNKNRGNR